MTATLRVRFEDETDPTFPGSWGWGEDETADYMRKIESADYVVLQASLEHLCEHCNEWHDAGQYLGDIHVLWDELYPADGNGGLRIVTLDDIPHGPTWMGPNTPSNFAAHYTPSDNYLHHVAADLIAEWSDNARTLSGAR
jgi:hypothetical protein